MAENFILHRDFCDKKIIFENDRLVFLLNPIKELRWFILVPKINNLKNILDLSETDYDFYNKRILRISQILNTKFLPDQINIASLGNITQQLHFHIILRFKADKFWPASPFDHQKEIMQNNEIDIMINLYKEILNSIIIEESC